MGKLFYATFFLVFCFFFSCGFGRDHAGQVANWSELRDDFPIFTKRIEKIDSLIQLHPYPWYKNHAYLLCIEKLAPRYLYLNVPQEFVKKIDSPSFKLMGSVLIAKYHKKYGNQEKAKLTLENASEEFEWDSSCDYAYFHWIERKSKGWAKSEEITAPEMILFLKKNLSTDIPGALPFLSKIYDKLLIFNERCPSFDSLLTLTELEIAFPFLTNFEKTEENQTPEMVEEDSFFWTFIDKLWNRKNNPHAGIADRIEKIYKMAMPMPSCWDPNHKLLRLFECMAKTRSPLCMEMISQLRQKIMSHEAYEPDFGLSPFAELFQILLSVEAKYPFLSSFFEEDFDHILRLIEESQKSLNYDEGLCDKYIAKIVQAIAPYNLEAAKRLLTRIHSIGVKTSAWLDCMKVAKSKQQVNLDEAYESFTSRVCWAGIPWQNHGDCLWADIFLKSADIFGVEKTMFTLDMLIKMSQKSTDSLYKDVGLIGDENIPLITSDDILSKCELINPYALSDVLKCLSAHQLPGTQELLERMYQQVKEGMGMYSYEMIEMVRAELVLIDIDDAI